MKKNRILIVDDAELNREILSEMLGDEYDYTYAGDGMEVIDILNDFKLQPDLILLDLHMPKMSGMEVLHIMNVNHWIEEIPVIIISSEDDEKVITKAYQLGVTDFISCPFRSVLVRNRIKSTMLLFKNQKRLIRMVENQVQEREKTNNAMINIFSNIIELKNHESGSHTLNVQNIANLLLHRLTELTDRYSINESDIILISSLAALHDIGKIRIPEAILNKPGRLNDEEWALMITHTTEGDKILSHENLDQKSMFIRTARAICRWHHEKYDGKGYPDGLVGDAIPIAAQVVSLADAYDALISERCYKKAFSHETAVEMLLSGQCGIFNPLLLKCLTDISDWLKELMQNNDYTEHQSELSLITKELLSDTDLLKNDALRLMLNNECRKKDFFMEQCHGILFEYDKLLHKITYVYPQENGKTKRKVVFSSRDSKGNLLLPESWDALREKLLMTTQNEPVAVMDVMLNIDGQIAPYRVTAMALWPNESNSEYTCVLGHFTPISPQK